MYRLVTSKETKNVFSGSFVLSMKFIKSVVFLRQDFCDFAIGWSKLSRNADICSIGPSFPDTIGLPMGVGL